MKVMNRPSRSTPLQVLFTVLIFISSAASECIGTRPSSCSAYDVDHLFCSIPAVIEVASCTNMIDVCKETYGCNQGCICSRTETGCQTSGFVTRCDYDFSCEGGPRPCSSITDRSDCREAGNGDCEWIEPPTAPTTPAPVPDPTLSPTEPPTQTGTWWYTQRFLARIRRRAPWNSDSTCAFGPQIVEITCNDPSSTIEQVAQATTTIFPITQTSCTVSAGASKNNTMTCEIPGEEAGPNFNNPGRWYVAIEYTCYGTEITTSSMVYKASQEECNLVLPLPSHPSLFVTSGQLATWCGIGSYKDEYWSSDKVNMVCGSEVEFQETFYHYSGTELLTCHSLVASFDGTTAGTQLLSFPEITMGTVEDTYYLDRYRFCVEKEFIADVDVVGGGGNNASPTAAQAPVTPEPTPLPSPPPPVPDPTPLPTPAPVTVPPTPTLGTYTQEFLARFVRFSFRTNSVCDYGPQTIEILCDYDGSTIEFKGSDFESVSCTNTAGNNAMTCTDTDANQNFGEDSRAKGDESLTGFVYYECRGDQLSGTSLTFQASQESCDIVNDGGQLATHARLATVCGDEYASSSNFLQCISTDGQNYYRDEPIDAIFGCYTDISIPSSSGQNSVNFPRVSIKTNSQIVPFAEENSCYTFEESMVAPTEADAATFPPSSTSPATTTPPTQAAETPDTTSAPAMQPPPPTSGSSTKSFAISKLLTCFTIFIFFHRSL